MRGYINKHNMKMMGERDDGIEEQECNCQRVNCPRPGAEPGMNCRTRNTIYKAKIVYEQNDNMEEKNYIGATAQELKDRVAFHRSCNRSESREKATELAKEAHRLQRNGTRYTIEWEILEKANSIRPGENDRTDPLGTNTVPPSAFLESGARPKNVLLGVCRSW